VTGKPNHIVISLMALGLALLACILMALGLTLLGSTFVQVYPPTDLALSNATLCRGWDSEGEPIELTDPVPFDETSICVCGHLDLDQDVFLKVSWTYEDDTLLRREQLFRSGPFLSCLTSGKDFGSGNYEASVATTVGMLALIEFTVGE
jgi:hypothetical protein